MALVVLSPLLPRLSRLMPPCLFKWLTGLPCPGCGTTRAAMALAELDPLAALRWNPLGALFAAGLVLGGLVAGARALRGHGVPEPRVWPVWVRLGAVAALLLNWSWLLADGR